MDERADLIDFLWRTLGGVSDWVRFADAKAGAALAVDGVMVVLLAGRLTRTPAPGAFVAVILSAALALAAVSALAAVWTVVPRMKRLGASAMIHYGTLASFDTAEACTAAFKAKLADPDEMISVLTTQIWTLSRAADRKYKLVGTSVRLLAGALAVGLLGVLLG
ncbi:DUF5706 domain-containing protein [Lentzea alba]|uniref:Pycsar system effector family protein n=1 Tax=Lentzea alba TaxID=2714351 RepID=UPI0039BED688